MAHLLGVYIPNNQKILIGFTRIYGIGKASAIEICSLLGINPNGRIKDLSDHELNQVSKHVESNFLIQSDLIKKRNFFLKRLLSIKSHRGLRHFSGLPLRGQRTKSNGKTQKRIGKRIKI